MENPHVKKWQQSAVFGIVWYFLSTAIIYQCIVCKQASKKSWHYEGLCFLRWCKLLQNIAQCYMFVCRIWSSSLKGPKLIRNIKGHYLFVCILLCPTVTRLWVDFCYIFRRMDPNPYIGALVKSFMRQNKVNDVTYDVIKAWRYEWRHFILMTLYL